MPDVFRAAPGGSQDWRRVQALVKKYSWNLFSTSLDRLVQLLRIFSIWSCCRSQMRKSTRLMMMRDWIREEKKKTILM
ncbi:hypothetical protein EYF80_054239 [Liparis tanakae]|uniref:Uncharacterized protein n=1 Tax=Liparis tanakae TaxID=230148 RepID=A0A4Z2F374_9TELE|nr:hypothetical protein EYF80_054239 [Liparis tanakae]